MKSRNLLLVLVIITIVIFVAFVPYIDLENKELDSAIIEDETNENASNNNEKEQTPDEKNNEINNITTNRIVFIEEGTSSWCYNCADVASVLDELYNPDDPDFYYISMVEDKNDKANSRLYSDYNAFGFPTVYIDGGYSVIAGSKDFKSNFKQKLSEAKSRKASDISLNVSSEWNETRKELKNTVTVYNNEDEIYMGRLRVYISEMISPWPDWNGDPYKFAFVDYGLDKNIIIDANENKTFSEIWDSTGFSNVYKENLWVVAVVFNS